MAEKIFGSYHVERFQVGDAKDMQRLSDLIVDPHIRIENKQIIAGEVGMNPESGEMLTSPDRVLLSYCRIKDW